MRTIRFRVWDSKRKKMFIPNISDPIQSLNDWFFESQKTGWEIMQFTGLFDKNHVDIYEGDIVKDKPAGMKEFVLEIKWNEMFARFDLWDKGSCSRVDLVNSPTCYEVIGNIFEHPNLLTK